VDVPEIDVGELERRRADGVPLLDVRQPDEYVEAHVPGAVLIPLDQLPDRLGEVPAGGPVAVICRSGGRSLAAAQFLRTNGVDAINVAGGTLAWVESGRAYSSGSESG
jgi:rhodanese-related sulfurtransferase